jgi:hypothetical protein
MPIPARHTRVMRLLVPTLLGCLALAAPASAKYLHLSEAQSAVHQYVPKIYAPAAEPFTWYYGHCWRVDPHLAQCGFEDQRSSIDLAMPHVAVIALRGDKLYGHTLDFDTPQFIRRL